MSMENLLRAAIKERKTFMPKGQGLPLTDEDLEELRKEWEKKWKKRLS